MLLLFSLLLFLLPLERSSALNLCQPYAYVQNLLLTFKSSGAITGLSFEFAYSLTRFGFLDFPIFLDLASLIIGPLFTVVETSL